MKTYTPPFEEEIKSYNQPDYTDQEIKYRTFLIDRLESARNQREDSHIEFDDRNYTDHYDTNYKAGNSYLRPKKNKFDSRIVTGTTLEKENTFISMMLNYNFEPNISVFDKTNLPLTGLGNKIESLVKKSFQLESFEDKEPLILKEATDQGTAFVEDVWVEEWEIQKKLKKIDYKNFKVDDIKWETKRKKKVIGCRANLIPGTGVYLGNVKNFFIETQPYLFTRDVITYGEAKACYEAYDRFQYVPRKIEKTNETEDGSEVRDWSLEQIEGELVEVIKYEDKKNNEYMLLLNGVMMYSVGFPLTEISPSGEYNLVKFDIEAISRFFAYSKGIPAKTKIDQEVLDDTLRTMVLRLRQMQAPPMANNTGTILSQNIFYPGQITPDINPNQIQPIIQNNTIGAGEFNVYQLIKQIVDEKTMNPIVSGQTPEQKQTATQVLQEKQQSMMKLGYAVYGIIAFYRKLTWLRIYNILTHWTAPIDSQIDEVKQQIKDMYQRISVEEQDEYGRFTRVIEFDNSGLDKSQAQLDAEAEIMSTPGNQVQKIYLNGKKLREKALEYNFFVNVAPIPKESSQLDATMFEERIGKAKVLFGPMSTNDEYLKMRWAVMSKEDPEKYWAKQQPTMPQGIPQGAPQSPMSNQIAQGVSRQPQPSLNSVIKQ